MKAFIDENYYVSSDRLNYILMKRGGINPKTGEQAGDRHIGFFGRTQYGLKQLADCYLRCVQNDQAKGFNGVFADLVGLIIRSNEKCAEQIGKSLSEKLGT